MRVYTLLFLNSRNTLSANSEDVVALVGKVQAAVPSACCPSPSQLSVASDTHPCKAWNAGTLLLVLVL